MNEIQTAIGTLSRRVNHNTTTLDQNNTQTRTLVTDDFDKEYQVSGENGTVGVWLALSGDMIYIERWEFKLISEPFTVPVSSGGMVPVSLNIDTSSVTSTGSRTLNLNGTLDVEDDQIDLSDGNISPRSHSHSIDLSGLQITPNPHTHDLTAGVTHVDTDYSNLQIALDGVDLTAQFKQQFPSWIQGQGMFPDTSLENRFDILKALTYINDDVRSQLLTPGYHRLTFTADGLFSFKIREFKKYNFLNRR